MNKVSIVGDFGGTNARLALSTPTGISEPIEYKCKDFPSGPAAVVKDFLTKQGIEKADRAVIAIAGASEDPSKVVFTNGPWKQKPLDFTAIAAGQVETINDLAAVCYAVAAFSEADCTSLINDHATPFFPASLLASKSDKANPSGILQSKPEHRFVVVGAGTGLGVGSGMVTDSHQLLVAGGEGGHIAFAPKNHEELELKTYLQFRVSAVTAETIASGSGLVTVFNAFCRIYGDDSEIKSGDEVVKKLKSDKEVVRIAAHNTLKIFASTLGTAAAAAALVNNARTVFISSGIIEKMGEHFNKEAFAKAFTTNDLGKNNALPNVSVMLITHPQPGLAGADAYLKLTAA